MPCDLSDPAAVEGLVPAAEAAAGTPLDILVNNAGITRDNLFMRMRDEEWDQVIAVNLTTGFRLARACLKGMMRRRYGRIIAVTSVVGTTGNAGQANYAASKAGTVGLTKSLAMEAATRNVTANCIAPGFIETPMTDVAQRQAEGRDPRRGADGAARAAGGRRRLRGLPRERRGRLRHRPDAPRERRHGDDLTAVACRPTISRCRCECARQRRLSGGYDGENEGAALDLGGREL